MEPESILKSRAGLRLGVLGGAFDPIHLGHLLIAEEALRQFTLDEVLFVPTGAAPHKGAHVASAEDRVTMVTLATVGHPRFWVSRHEIDSAGVEYTVDTLLFLRKTLELPDLYFLVGADAFLEVLTWKEPHRLADICTLVAATRPGYDVSGFSPVIAALGNRAKVQAMEIPHLDISSTMIRERVAAGQGIRYLVPDAVADYIEKKGIYLRHSPERDRTA